MTFFEILMSLSVSLIQSPNNIVNLQLTWLYGDIRHQYLRYYIFYVLFRFLMISKGSWVALATCSAESPIASIFFAIS